MIKQEKSPVCGRAWKNKFSNKHNTTSYEKVNDAAASYLPCLLSRWLPDGRVQGSEYVALNPKRADSRLGSFKINMRTCKWSDFATGECGSDVISLAAYLFDLPQSQAKNKISEMLGV